jgi:hypothetical protein
MELLIPGLILVALMVYASTRIKKTAAAAYEAETIESDEFVIQKPEGFLHNLNGDPKYIFEAYSKEFSKANEKLRAGTAAITRIENANIETIGNELAQKDGLTEDESLMIGECRYRILGFRSEDESSVYKLAEGNGGVYKLEVRAAEESGDWVETFTDSFVVK